MLPKRKSPRAKFHNYSNGDYFVTICTSNKEHYFGVINKGEMCLSMIGKYCKIQLDNITNHYPYASVPLYVIMPNHIHAIISIDFELRTHGSCVQEVSPRPTCSQGACSTRDAGCFLGALCLHRRYIRALLSCNTCLLSKFNPYGVYFLLSPFSTLLYLLYICKIFADMQQIYDYY